MRKIVIPALILAVSGGAALADTHLGWYVAADAGLHRTGARSLSVHDVSVQSSVSSSTDSSFESSSFSSSSASPNSGEGRIRALSAASTSAADFSDELPDHDLALRAKQAQALFLRAGYQFTPHWRLEGEIGDRKGDIRHDIAVDRTSTSGVHGSVAMTSAMLNLLYDFAPDSKVHPFVGIGGGAVKLKTDYSSAFDEDDTSDLYNIATRYDIHQSKTYGAWQGLAGLTWAISDRLSLDVTYRYLDLGTVHDTVNRETTYQYDVSSGCDSEFEECGFPNDGPNDESARPATDGGRTLTPVSALRFGSTTTYSVDRKEHINTSSRLHDDSISIGLRWAFATPPAPVAPVAATPAPPPPAPVATPAPPPAPVDSSVEQAPPKPEPQTFVVYFAFDRSNLGQPALDVIAAAANFAKSHPAPAVMVTGHTDTAGSNAYNVALSMRRAHAVADGLVADGVDAGDIKTGWTGETDLAIPTPNGTPKPQNRRTTIDVAF